MTLRHKKWERTLAGEWVNNLLLDTLLTLRKTLILATR